MKHNYALRWKTFEKTSLSPWCVTVFATLNSNLKNLKYRYPIFQILLISFIPLGFMVKSSSKRVKCLLYPHKIYKNTNLLNYFLGKLHKRVPNYSVFSLKGTNVAKRSIECKNLSKPFNVEYSVTLRSKSMTEVESRDFHVIFNGVFPVMPLKKMLKYT
jgi:hypothetical protein